MMLSLVPHGASSTEGSIWVGVFESPQRPGAGGLRSGARSWAIDEERWESITVGDALEAGYRTAWRQVVRLDGLESGHRYDVVGALGGERAACRVSTLPQKLPRELERPFVVLLGSCFAAYRDAVGVAGLNVANLPEFFKPDVKILTGDQVYLDNPVWEVLPRSRGGLAKRFFDKYVTTWTQGRGHGGFSAMLAEGAAYFLADDHELWNNHPNWNPLIFTRDAEARRRWAEVAEALYATFQAVPGANLRATQRFSVGDVEFQLSDTRFGRLPGDSVFMDPAELDRLVGWLRAGITPGVLALAAPLFTEAAGWFAARFMDRTLANYQQYHRLVEAIVESQRPLLLISGDVHFGRVALAHRGSGVGIVEIVASPLALVHESVGGEFKPAPAHFPSRGRGVPRLDVHTEEWQEWTGDASGLVKNHFLTLSFTGTDDSVQILVVAWEISSVSPYEPTRRGSYEFTFLRRAG